MKHAPPPKRTRAASAIAQYVQHIRDLYPSREWRNVRSALARIATIRDLRADELVSATRQLLEDRDLSTTYRRSCFAKIRRFAAWCHEHELLDQLPEFTQLPRRLPPQRRKPDDLEQRPRLADPCRPAQFLEHVQRALPLMAPWARDAIRLIAYTGARPLELLALRTRDIDTSSSTTWIATPATHKTDAYDVDRRLVISGPAINIIDRRLMPITDADWIFPAARDRSRHIHPNQLAQHVRRIQQRRKLAKWTPYDLRRAAAGLARQHQGLDAAQALLGHTDSRTTERHYARLQMLEGAVAAAQLLAKEVQL